MRNRKEKKRGGGEAEGENMDEWIGEQGRDWGRYRWKLNVFLSMDK